jgi:hypothetical protein
VAEHFAATGGLFNQLDVKISSVALGQILAEVDLTFRALQVGGLPFVRDVLVIFSRISTVVLAAAVIPSRLLVPSTVLITLQSTIILFEGSSLPHSSVLHK